MPRRSFGTQFTSFRQIVSVGPLLIPHFSSLHYRSIGTICANRRTSLSRPCNLHSKTEDSSPSISPFSPPICFFLSVTYRLGRSEIVPVSRLHMDLSIRYGAAPRWTSKPPKKRTFIQTCPFFGFSAVLYQPHSPQTTPDKLLPEPGSIIYVPTTDGLFSTFSSSPPQFRFQLSVSFIANYRGRSFPLLFPYSLPFISKEINRPSDGRPGPLSPSPQGAPVAMFLEAQMVFVFLFFPIAFASTSFAI